MSDELDDIVKMSKDIMDAIQENRGKECDPDVMVNAIIRVLCALVYTWDKTGEEIYGIGEYLCARSKDWADMLKEVLDEEQ